jgi:transposase-like protein
LTNLCINYQCYVKKNFCPKCALSAVIKKGYKNLKIFTKLGWQNKQYQKYQCSVCGHIWHNADLFGMFTRSVIAQAIFMYLRGMSLNATASIFRSWYDTDIFSKVTLIKHIEEYTEQIPDHFEITRWLKPNRSGYYALDGTWLKYRGRDIVLLILFDVKTLDIVNWRIAREECRESYNQLLVDAYFEIETNIKGFFCDGDPGLLKAIKDLFPGTPIQLCVFHKYMRAGQLIPFKRIRNDIDREIKKKVEAVLFAKSKEEAIASLAKLKRYAREHQKHEKLQKLIGVLKRNFHLLLTHFDNEEMSPYNNVLEGFNYIVKRKTNLMKGFKKPININRWLKLIMLDWRFHYLNESQFTDRRNKSPLELAGCELPKINNWIKFIYKNYRKSRT